MTPTLEHGDLLVVDTREETEPRIGDVVVLDTQKKGERRVIVKRVSSRGRQTWAVSSDNPLEGQDSRQLGSFERDDIIGRVELSLSNKRPPRIHRSRR